MVVSLSISWDGNHIQTDRADGCRGFPIFPGLYDLDRTHQIILHLLRQVKAPDQTTDWLQAITFSLGLAGKAAVVRGFLLLKLPWLQGHGQPNPTAGR